MDTIKITNKGKTLMVAHRGVSGLETENTASAFVGAGNRSYYGIETDIHQTSDGKFVLFHDSTTERIGGINFEVEKTDFDTLRSLVLKDRFTGEKTRNDIRIATLDEYISICKHYEKQAVIELKSDFTLEQITEICDTIKSRDYLDGVTFIAFNYDNLVKVRSLYPNQSAQFLTFDWTDDLVDKIKALAVDLDIYYKALTKERVDLLKAEGIKINCWTVDNPEDAERLISWGVDYITSNILE